MKKYRKEFLEMKPKSPRYRKRSKDKLEFAAFDEMENFWSSISNRGGGVEKPL